MSEEEEFETCALSNQSILANITLIDLIDLIDFDRFHMIFFANPVKTPLRQRVRKVTGRLSLGTNICRACLSKIHPRIFQDIM